MRHAAAMVLWTTAPGFGIHPKSCTPPKASGGTRHVRFARPLDLPSHELIFVFVCFLFVFVCLKASPVEKICLASGGI
jgi:hypothetical protein